MSSYQFPDNISEETRREAELFSELQNMIEEYCLAGDFETSRTKLKEFLEHPSISPQIELNCARCFIDIGKAAWDENDIKAGIEIITGQNGLLSRHAFEDPKLRFAILYFLSEGYGSFFRICARKEITDGLEECLQKEKRILQEILLNIDVFRDFIADSSTLNFEDAMHSMYIEYANCLGHLGRSVETISYYQDALRLKPDDLETTIHLAIEANKLIGINMHHNNKILYYCFHSYAKFLASNDPSLPEGMFAQAQYNLVITILNIEKFVPGGFEGLFNYIQSSSHIVLSDQQRKFSNETLLLTIDPFPTSQPIISADDLCYYFSSSDFEGSDTELHTKLIYLLNQLKENFSVARYLYYFAQEKSEELSKADLITCYTVVDDAEFSLQNGMLKTSYKRAADTLDTIAELINLYFDLHDKGVIYFDNVWYKNRKEAQGFHPTVSEKIENNIYLKALFDIHKDWRVFPGDMKELRNTITHRWLAIYNEENDDQSYEWVDFRESDIFTPPNPNQTNSAREKSTIEDLLSRTFYILRLARSAIIYIVATISFEEYLKEKE